MLFSLRNLASRCGQAVWGIAAAAGLMGSAPGEAALHEPATLKIAYLDSFSPDFYVEVYAPTVQHL